MSQSNPDQPNQPDQANAQTTIHISNTEAYRDGYANSVQVRMSVWDFQLVFGTMRQDSADAVTLQNFQGVYLSPQQAKALWNVLGNNLAQYEATFGQLTLEPQPPGKIQIIPIPQPGGPVN
ncbi:DUF3467 domain-containing protein [Granulicella tundricola]|uniref:DUF3467 domain-containing protein n=1 Tax=Granulicella tundricola (strain ATCC BAA-1859 / DSM 23138 / MP5ACTX9) TaxID=1198114 RepID=E8WYC5_GRATM|nr:DUF3467 domain-containing protein [Granulicella tundricola]ADW69831.1 hypothetical protein AciX9_2808 [Granulicella tundricola MP5ACTX9]